MAQHNHQEETSELKPVASAAIILGAAGVIASLLISNTATLLIAAAIFLGGILYHALKRARKH